MQTMERLPFPLQEGQSAFPQLQGGPAWVTTRELEIKNNSGRRSIQQLYCRPRSKLYCQQHSQPKGSCDSQSCSISPTTFQLRVGVLVWVHVKVHVT